MLQFSMTHDSKGRQGMKNMYGWNMVQSMENVVWKKGKQIISRVCRESEAQMWGGLPWEVMAS